MMPNPARWVAVALAGFILPAAWGQIEHQPVGAQAHQPPPVNTAPLVPSQSGGMVPAPNFGASYGTFNPSYMPRRTNAPLPLDYDPQSPFSTLPTSFTDYHRFVGMKNEASPYSLTERLTSQFSTGATGDNMLTPETQLLNPMLKSNVYSNPTGLKNFYSLTTQAPGVPRSMQLVWVQSGKALTGPVNERLLQSSLFRGVQIKPMPVAQGQLLDREETRELERRMVRPLRPEKDTTEGRLIRPVKRLGEGEGERPDTLLQVENIDAIKDEQVEGLKPLDATGGEVFGQMLSRLAQMAEERPAEIILPDEGILLRAPDEDALDGPIGTFVGTSETELNETMKQAEKLLKAGEYYRAANTYQLAQLMSPKNPLPFMGQSMAYLGAGDYLTSVSNLFQAIELFPMLAYFDLDITAFLPDIRTLDHRRAELEQQLREREDFRFRFLMGFAEYSSGLHVVGVRDMVKAAEHIPSELIQVHRFVEILQDRYDPPPQDEP